MAGFDLDRDPEAIRRRIGVVFQGSILDARLTVKENLTIRASFYGINGEQWKKRLDELCDRFDLAEILTRPYGKLSGGQRRRVDVARESTRASCLFWTNRRRDSIRKPAKPSGRRWSPCGKKRV